jgi:cellulose synthase/poly-beta-1,6-N-acetylglucosamine synthase-like glycosyltransferase
MTAVATLFWLCAGLIVYTHAGYPIALRALLALRRHPVETWPGLAEDDPAHPPPSRRATGDASALSPAPATDSAASSVRPGIAGSHGSPAGTVTPLATLPSVSLIVPAYDEEEVIAAKVANALALDYPRERLQLIVASDGSSDATVERARAAGADLVLELPPGGKIAALNAAAEQATGELLAFSDANSAWAPDALRRLLEPFADPTVGYVCGQVRFTDEGGSNLEGAYWRYEMAVRSMESALGGITAGNGAIYAVRCDAYLPLAPSGSHDLSFPFELAKRGLRSLYAPAARAEEKMVPTMEGEFARKRRMMVGLWDIVVGEGMLSPRGYSPLFAFELASHRLLRYLSPALHLVVLGTNVALLGQGTIYIVTFAAQLALIAAALLARRYPLAPLRIARYYVMTTASIAAGLWDRWRHGSTGRWEKAEGTR